MKSLPLLLLLVLLHTRLSSQMITGVWKGRINRQNVELKIIQKGDSLTGTSYYYQSPSQYRRYAIKGYFDAQTNETVWWDDHLIEEKNGGRNGGPALSRADFNCPGSGRMMLDGKAQPLDQPEKSLGEIHFNKIESGIFQDEWNFIIDNYLVGGNDPDLIDSIGMLAYQQPISEEIPIAPVVKAPAPVVPKPAPSVDPVPVAVTQPNPPVQSIEEKFSSRKKEYTLEIPVSGDSIELKFYDNAQVDGDSISLFLNDRLIFQHIRLTAMAHTIKIPVNELAASSELVMVAENLGEIPPNTSYMVALVGNRRYEAMLTSTEQSSAVIKLVKTPAAGSAN